MKFVEAVTDGSVFPAFVVSKSKKRKGVSSDSWWVGKELSADGSVSLTVVPQMPLPTKSSVVSPSLHLHREGGLIVVQIAWCAE